ncbi:plasma membrane-associated cation-binding protein 1 [Malania oleifera]|uniref:plasma membrane-associated cation-binding protein 1 n=1 Tax=Malania oleifera TaxID=397392 RepID=UPI0025AE296B|nr:plasma membrane-associated cation-binding protein 1 [Malania oleifera]
MDYWKSKVLPKIKKFFDKNGSKKAAASEACKSFDDSKEEINKEFEEKKTELQPKVIEIYEASSVEIKSLVKERKQAGIKKHSSAVQKFLEELTKIGFPGSKPASEASSKYGPASVSGPVSFVFEKVSTFIVEPPPATAAAAAAGEETTGKKEATTAEEIVAGEGKEKEPEKTEAAVAEELAKADETEPPKP